MILQSAPVLQAAGLSTTQLMTCPECRKKFVAHRGVVFETHYKAGGVSKFGFLNYCSPHCVLSWVQSEECGHC